jgi:prevent-host-death family protein
MTMITVMIVVNINEAKAKLSEYLELTARGERVLICNRNRPVAELRAVAAARREPRPLGGAVGRVTVPDAFFEPLPDDLLDAFEGRVERPGVVRRPTKVAEAAPPYGGRSAPRRKRRP